MLQKSQEDKSHKIRSGFDQKLLQKWNRLSCLLFTFAKKCQLYYPDKKWKSCCANWQVLLTTFVATKLKVQWLLFCSNFFSCGVGFGLYPSVSVDGKFVTMRCIFFSPPKEYPPPPVFCNAQGVKHLIPFDNWEKNVSTEPTRYF